MESAENKERRGNFDGKFNQDIYSKVVRAGKRTYFFDVKATRNDELYLTITESKKQFEDNGNFHFEKHKVFLYKEDFEKFAEGLHEIINFIREEQPEQIGENAPGTVEAKAELEVETKSEIKVEAESETVPDYINVDFEDI